MKDITSYISEYAENKVLNEGLLSWLNAFIKKVNNAQKKLIQGGKVNMLKMDINKLQFQKEPARLEDLSKDKYAMDIWKDTKLGFPLSAEVATKIKKYCPNTDDSTANPLVYTFYYKSTDTYYAGVIIYEKEIQKITDYLNVVSIEINQAVDNYPDVAKAMFNQFKNLMANSNKSIVGYSVDTNIFDQRFKNELTDLVKKIGFKESEDNNFTGIYILEK